MKRARVEFARSRVAGGAAETNRLDVPEDRVACRASPSSGAGAQARLDVAARQIATNEEQPL